MTTEIKKLSNGNTQIIARKNDKEVILTINEDLKVVHLDATEGWANKAPQVEAEEHKRKIDLYLVIDEKYIGGITEFL